jgi:hypothetical protein
MSKEEYVSDMYQYAVLVIFLISSPRTILSLVEAQQDVPLRADLPEIPTSVFWSLRSERTTETWRVCTNSHQLRLAFGLLMVLQTHGRRLSQELLRSAELEYQERTHAIMQQSRDSVAQRQVPWRLERDK